MGIVSRMRDAVIVGGARTAVGRLLGSLSGFSGADLGGIVIAEALRRAGVPAGASATRSIASVTP